MRGIDVFAFGFVATSSFCTELFMLTDAGIADLRKWRSNSGYLIRGSEGYQPRIAHWMLTTD
jgi:hypothetical protein